jgi:hypothetical protein
LVDKFNSFWPRPAPREQGFSRATHWQQLHVGISEDKLLPYFPLAVPLLWHRTLWTRSVIDTSCSIASAWSCRTVTVAVKPPRGGRTLVQGGLNRNHHHGWVFPTRGQAHPPQSNLRTPPHEYLEGTPLVIPRGHLPHEYIEDTPSRLTRGHLPHEYLEDTPSRSPKGTLPRTHRRPRGPPHAKRHTCTLAADDARANIGR